MVCTKTPISSLQVRKAYDMDEDDETGRENFRIKANLLFVIFDRFGFSKLIILLLQAALVEKLAGRIKSYVVRHRVAVI